jgi:hypothetical protein
MNKFVQTVSYLISFIFLLLLGSLIYLGLGHYNFYAAELFDGKPLPGITMGMISIKASIPYLLLFPWLGFVGVPFVRRTGDYWDTQFYLLRFSFFLLIEALLCFLIATAFALPFIALIYGEIENPHLNTTELFIRGGFWITAAGIIAMAIWRIRAKTK